MYMHHCHYLSHFVCNLGMVVYLKIRFDDSDDTIIS